MPVNFSKWSMRDVCELNTNGSIRLCGCVDSSEHLLFAYVLR